MQQNIPTEVLAYFLNVTIHNIYKK